MSQNFSVSLVGDHPAIQQLLDLWNADRSFTVSVFGTVQGARVVGHHYSFPQLRHLFEISPYNWHQPEGAPVLTVEWVDVGQP